MVGEPSDRVQHQRVNFLQIFDERLSQSIQAATAYWSGRGWAAKGTEQFREQLCSLLPSELRSWIGYGFHHNILRPDGFHFNFASLKNRGSWFARPDKYSAAGYINWEYFVHAFYFVKIYEPCVQAGLPVLVEQNKMDIAVRTTSNQLLWYIEAKSDLSSRGKNEFDEILKMLPVLGDTGIDRRVPPQKNDSDSLKKAWTIVTERPKFFTIVTEVRVRHFELTYNEPSRFELAAILPPIHPLIATITVGDAPRPSAHEDGQVSRLHRLKQPKLSPPTLDRADPRREHFLGKQRERSETFATMKALIEWTVMTNRFKPGRGLYDPFSYAIPIGVRTAAAFYTDSSKAGRLAIDLTALRRANVKPEVIESYRDALESIRGFPRLGATWTSFDALLLSEAEVMKAFQKAVEMLESSISQT